MGCGDDRRPLADSGADASLDASDSGSSDGSTDASADVDSSVPPTCPTDVVTGVPFAIDPDGDDGQIHASVAWDGERAVIAYNRPDPTDGFDVYVTTLSCDGTPGTPVRINTTDENDVDPALARGTDGYFVAWTSDDGTGGTDNLHIFGRGLDAELAPLGDTDVEIRTARMGAAVPGNHLITTLVPDGDGYAIGGERGLDSIMRFHAFAQRIDAMGALTEEAFEPAYEPMVSHMNVAVASTASGLVVAYDRAPDMEDPQVYFQREGATDPPELVVDGLASTSGAWLLSTSDALFAALSGDVIPGATDVRLTELSTALAERPVETLGAASRLDVAPHVVWGEGDSGAIAYQRLSGGSFGPLLVQRFTWDGSAFTIGPEVEVAGSAAAYGPAIAHVTGDIYFLAWAEGMSPALRLFGSFVDLSP